LVVIIGILQAAYSSSFVEVWLLYGAISGIKLKANLAWLTNVGTARGSTGPAKWISLQAPYAAASFS
jgi:hypothetical protein